MPSLIAPVVAGAFFASGTIGFALIEVAVGLAFSLGAQALFGDKTAKSKEQERDLSFPTERPYYRFVMGEARATATVLPHPTVGEYGYGVYLLNSAPSDGTPVIILDGREIPLTGDPYDFEGSGATPSSGDLSGHLNVWIGLGDQTGPPDDYISGCAYNATTQPLGFQASDAGAGLTIVYLRYRAGDNGSISTRWPNVPPRLEVDGLRTPVYDMREVGHDPDDQDTWEGTSNHALNTLHVLRHNPFRPYDDKYLLLDMFEDAADIDDESVTLGSGGSEARYTLDGTVIFDGSELEEIMTPILEAGAAALVRDGGRIGIVPGVYSEPVMTIDSVLEGLSFSNMKRSKDLPTQMKTVYVAKNRGYAEAELELWDIPGVGVNEEPNVTTQQLPYTTSAYRAMRLRKIRALRDREQRSLSGIIPPEGIKLKVRSGLTMALGAPYDTRIDGTYEVSGMHPLASPLGDDQGVALRIPATMIGTSAATYAWTTAEEETVFDPPYDVARNGVQPPGAITATTGSTVNGTTGDQIIPRVRYDGDPSPSAGVTEYEWQGRDDGGVYGERGGTFAPDVLDGDGDIFVFVEGEAGQDQDFRWRAWVGSEYSSWVEITGVTPVVTITLTAPAIGTPTESPAGTAQIPVVAPNDANCRGVEVYAGPDSDVANASPLDLQYCSQNQSLTFQEGGLGSPETRYYFARTIGPFSGNVSAWTAGVSITTA